MTPQRVFLLLTATRWFPVGLVVSVTTLLPIERGLSVGQTLTLASVMGLVVFALELPTGGTADAVGRRPMLVAAAVAQVLAATTFLLAQTVWAFVVAAALTGLFRALDSGPLEAWFVDAVHAEHPGADVDRTLAHQGTVLGASIALGALVSGGLVWWHPFPAWSALALPYAAYCVLAVAHLVMVVLLVSEPRPTQVEAVETRGLRRWRAGWRATADAARQAPASIASGLRLARDNRVLRGLLLVEIFAAAAMVVFESLQPVRLAELLGGEAQAGAVMGPVASVGWGVFALGAALCGVASRRFGVARTAMAARVLNGLGAVWMGLTGGPVMLVVAYLVTYGLHGSSGPSYNALLHREARRDNRSTVLSMASMVGFASYAVASPALGWVAQTTSTTLAMVLGGGFSVLGVLCFVPALRAERQRARQAPVAPVPEDAAAA
ncbi:MFS transporter [Krasilnikoviella flava]|uniref:Predicted arabinose efflux permease, MFS family n=1 Tax=Krasilnikoviella flava TaxID=526729 RepID=A0A1T5LGR9_9MICO|nr:MFS transporter [Krasilnikoviella flava]SKC75193.1 Predicted arabinose efflux permease, MFS family [Krasilnikoviella flava]